MDAACCRSGLQCGASARRATGGAVLELHARRRAAPGGAVLGWVALRPPLPGRPAASWSSAAPPAFPGFAAADVLFLRLAAPMFPLPRMLVFEIALPSSCGERRRRAWRRLHALLRQLHARAAELAATEAKYAAAPVTVVGVHSPKFAAEGDGDAAIRAAVLRYGVTHPVLNDARKVMWDALRVDAWPTLAVVGAYGPA
jgi:hypothetical protein